MDVRFLSKLLLQHDSSPDHVLENVDAALLAALRGRQVQAAVSPSGDGLAVALGQRLVVLRGLRSPHATPSVDFVSAVDAPEALTALAWLAAAGGGGAGGGAAADHEALLLGTSTGHLQLHAPATGALLLRQRLHHSAVVSAAVRWAGAGGDPDDRSEWVTLTCVDAVVKLPAWEVWAAVRWATARSAHRWWAAATAAGAAAHHQLSFSKFSLPKGAGPRSHAACLGPPPPSLHADLTGRGEGRTHRLRILTAGAAPPLATFEAEEAAAPGLLSLVSDLASSTAQSLLGAARAYVPGPAAAAGRTLLGGLRGGAALALARTGSGSSDGGAGAVQAAAAAQQQQQQQQRGGKKEKGIPGEPASLAAAVWDEKRAVTQMALSPCGRLAACCDTLGRVVLVDACGTLVVRMLKGYRDAQVAWLVCSSGGGKGGGGSSSLGALGLRGGSASTLGGSCASLDSSAADWEAAQQQQQQQQQQAGGQQGVGGDAAAGPEAQRRPPGCRHLLVTFAPRRAAVEVWEPQSLTRLGTVRCSVQAGLLLAQPVRLAGGGTGGGLHAHAPNRIWLLDAAALTLTDLTDSLASVL